MKKIIPLILICCLCYANWDQEDRSKLNNINTNISNIQQYVQNLNSPNSDININLSNIRGSNLDILKELQDINLGYNVNSENQNDLGLYSDFYNTVSHFGGFHFRMRDETQDFLDYIKSFSANNYINDISTAGTANAFMNNGQYFNYSEKMLIKLNNDGIDETDSWFHVDVYNYSNQSVKKVYSSINERVNELMEVPTDIVGSSENPNILFTLNLSSLNDMFVSFGLWNSNPIQSWIFPIKLIPEEGDYLYDYYTWWNSESFYPKTFRICLKGLICLFAFYYCYNYVVSTWNA